MFATDTWLRIMSGMMINAVLFGLGAVTVLSAPTLAVHAKYLIPAVVVVSFVLAPLISVWTARRMRIRNWGRESWKNGDLISG